MNRVTAASLFLALPGCATPLSEARTTGSPSAGFGQVALIENFRVKPMFVLEDSRCPTNVQCIWAGTVRLRVEVEAGAGSDVADLTLSTATELGGASLTLTAVEPERLADVSIRRSAYRFTFAIQRNG